MSRFNKERFGEISKAVSNVDTIPFKVKKDLLFELETMNMPISIGLSVFFFSLCFIGFAVVVFILPQKFPGLIPVWLRFVVVITTGFAMILLLNESFHRKAFNKKYKAEYWDISGILERNIEIETNKALEIIAKEKEETIKAFIFRLVSAGMKPDVAEYYANKKMRPFLKGVIKNGDESLDEAEIGEMMQSAY